MRRLLRSAVRTALRLGAMAAIGAAVKRVLEGSKPAPSTDGWASGPTPRPETSMATAPVVEAAPATGSPPTTAEGPAKKAAPVKKAAAEKTPAKKAAPVKKAAAKKAPPTDTEG